MTRLYNPLLSAIQTPLMGVANGPTLLAHYINGVDSLPTTSRTATIYARDHEGVYRDYQAGEVVIEGGRQVRNLAPNSTDMTSGWFVGATSNGSKTATTMTLTGPGDSYVYVTRSGTFSSGTTVVVSFDLNSYASGIAIRATNGSDGTNDADFIPAQTGRHSLTLTFTSSSNLQFGIDNRTFLGGDGTSGGTFEITNIQIEDVSGQSNQNPGEYVSSSVGMQTFATENGNTVASNVVTEGTGSALSPAPAVVTQPAFTNSCAYSQNIQGTGWQGYGAALNESRDQTDIFGAPNSAWTLEDANVSVAAGRNYVTTISDDTNTHTVRVWFKKTTSSTSFPGVQIVYSGGTQVQTVIAVDTDNGALATVPSWAVADDKSIDSDGDWWRVTISRANNGSGNTIGQLALFPAMTSDLVTFSASLTGSCIVDQMEIHLNPTNGHESVRYAGPIPTSGAAATTNPTEPVVSWPSGLGNDFVVKCRFTPASATQLSFARMLDWSGGNQDGYSIQISAGVFYFYKRISGTGYRTDRAQSLVAGTEYPIIFRASSLNGIAAWVSGTKSSGGSNPGNTDTPVTPSTVKVGGSDIATNLNALGKFTDIKIYSVPPDISDAEVLAL